jgi:hypothetical protein
MAQVLSAIVGATVLYAIARGKASFDAIPASPATGGGLCL